MSDEPKLAAGTGSSLVVERCQVCEDPNLEPVLFLGYLPPVNTMPPLGERPREQPGYPAELLFCPACQLAQLGLTVDKGILFPPEYPYTTGTTRILRDNFAELYREVQSLYPLGAEDLAIDIGANDGTLLNNFKEGGHRVHAIEPTERGHLAEEKGIPTTISYFTREVARKVAEDNGKARVITATNVFAHIEDIHEIVGGILDLLADDGVFISESHYLMGLVETLQYDTIYHEHLRYYSLTSLRNLLARHGLEVVHVKRIPTHGGSIRVYAAREGAHPPQESVGALLAAEEEAGVGVERLRAFAKDVVLSKLKLHRLLLDIKERGETVYGIAAPSRASTLINYVGIDDGLMGAVMEIKGSYKIGKYMPGTRIPVQEESALFADQPDYALMLAWHIADELMPKLKEKGFKGKFIVPLPEPRIV